MPLKTQACPDYVRADRPLTCGLRAPRCGPNLLLLLQARPAASRVFGAALLALCGQHRVLGGSTAGLHLGAAYCRQWLQVLGVCGRQRRVGAIAMLCLLGYRLASRELVVRG